MFDYLLNYLREYFTGELFLFHTELLLRIFIAFFCGAFIGRERKARGKGAGTKTHSIVAIASCLLMIISQYGFMDFLNHYSGTEVNINHDPSRIAAQIVTGIGFLGAGMIFVHKKTITGLTTAAGIWATAGIGMSVGAGMYFISIATTILIIIVQILSHKHFRFFTPATDFEIVLSVKDKDKALSYITELLDENEIQATSIETEYQSDNLFNIHISASTLHDLDKVELTNKLYCNDTVISAKI
ncbi:MAG: MgtC/SapB family protein [Clostridia bacterium]|nr:MgtC/SapB family protein [Clostridia bacterium]